MFKELSTSLGTSILYDFSKALLGRLSKAEAVQVVLKKLDASPRLHDFPERYVEALVELRVDGKPRVVLDFLRDESVMQTFYSFYYGDENARSSEETLWQELQNCLDALKTGEALKTEEVDTHAELDSFWVVFRQKVHESRTVKETELTQLVIELKQDCSDIRELKQALIAWMQGNEKEAVQIGEKVFNIQEIGTANFNVYFNIVLEGETRTPKNLTDPPHYPEVFLGRDADLVSVHQKLFGGDNLLLLVNGEGGIGKTALAAEYYRRHSDEYKHIAWVFAEKDLADAMLTLKPPLCLRFVPGTPAAEQLRLLFERLRELEKPCLLVIDNLNNPDQLWKHYLTLRSIPNFHLLVTTRIPSFEQAERYEIKPLADEDAFVLFRRYYPAHQESENTLLEAVLEAVGWNTLIIELFAKNLHAINGINTKYSLTNLLADLGSKGLFGIQTKPVSTVYHAEGKTLRREKPEDIAAAMYDLSELTNAESALMAVFAVLPAENILFDTLETLLPGMEDLEAGLLGLAQKGWLDRSAGQASFRVSPVVQEVARRKNGHLLADCSMLVESLIEKLETDPSSGHFIHASYIEAVLYARYAENVLQAFPEADYSITILYSRVGECHTTLGNLDKALSFFEDDAQLTKELYQAYPQNVGFKNGLAISYSKLGETHSALGNLDKALSFFEDETRLFEELYQAYPQNVGFKNGLAISYSKLGETHSALGNLDKALSFFEDETRLFEELYQAYPQNVGFKNGLAISYEKLGVTHSALGNLDKALSFFEDETRLFEELYQAYPQNVGFKNGLAISYEKLGETHSALGNLDKALSFFEDETRLFEELYQAYPQNVGFKNGLAISYSKLGETHSALGNLDKALSFFEERSRLGEELYQAYPQNVGFKNGLAISYEKLGETHSALGNLDKALSFFEDETRLFEELYQAYPQNVGFKNGLAISYSKLGETHSALGNLDKALSFFEDDAQLTKELYQAYPQNVGFKNGLAISYSKLGETHSALGNLDKALSFFEERSRLGEELYQAYPQNVGFKNGLAISYEKLGETHSALGNLDKALSFFEDETRLFEELYQAYPQNVGFKNGLAISYSKLGVTHSALGNLDKALSFFEDETRLFEELYQAYPQNVGFKNGLAVSYWKLGAFARNQKKDMLGARSWFEKARRLWEELVRDSPAQVQFRRFLEQVKRDIEDLQGE